MDEEQIDNIYPIVDDGWGDWKCCEEIDSEDEELLKNSADSAFSFETDHAALKGNSDYHSLIKTLTLLQVQRVQAVKDLEKLEQLRTQVKNNPREFLNKLVAGNLDDIPQRITVAKVPDIDWSKYSKKDGSEASRQSKLSSSAKGSKRNTQRSTKTAKDNDMTVRGRAFDPTKPQTFNQLWTAEEQLRLEELLMEFPPESNENNRWRKIAQALGNRTTTQVCSRVQKYFKKLNKVGLPIPGHQLKTNAMTSIKKKPRRKRKQYLDSTFFPTQQLGAHGRLDESDDEAKARPSASDLKADVIKKVLEYKKQDAQVSPFSHPGVKCSQCKASPLQGTRWRCLACTSINLCSDCVINQLTVEHPWHPSSHPFEPLSNPSVAHWDPDYMPESFKSTNYLDPNFITTNVL